MEASVAYEYAVFKAVEPIYRSKLMLKRAYALKQQGSFERAFDNLQRIDIYVLPDSMAKNVLYESALNAFLAERYDQSLSKLEELKIYPDSEMEGRNLILEILTLNEMKEWTKAHEHFLSYKKKFAPSLQDPYLQKIKMKNSERAFNLSYFLPGVGQMYAGYFWKGFLSGFINVGTVAFAGYSFLTGYYFSGAFTGVTLFYIFYNGGARYAEVLAEQYNREKGEEFNKSVRLILLE